MDNRINIGEIIRRQRISIPLTLQELAKASGVSPSYIGRIERGQRFPSARILAKIAKPLTFDENELFTLAGYLSPPAAGVTEKEAPYTVHRLDPYVAKVLSEQPVEIQRLVISLLVVAKTLLRTIAETGKSNLASPSGA